MANSSKNSVVLWTAGADREIRRDKNEHPEADYSKKIFKRKMNYKYGGGRL